MSDEPNTLGDALPREILPAYIEIGPAGAFAAAGMRRDLDAAAKAMIEGDPVEMLRVYQSLKEWHL